MLMAQSLVIELVGAELGAVVTDQSGIINQIETHSLEKTKEMNCHIFQLQVEQKRKG